MAGRKGAWWRAGVVIAGMLGLAAVAVLFVKDPRAAHLLAPLVGVMGTVVVSVLTPVVRRWWRSTKPAAAPTTADIADAEGRLAGLVEEQWNTEAALRSLEDPDPIPVQWRVTEQDTVMGNPATLATGTPLFAGSSDHIAELTDSFRVLRRRRLVILGGFGTGKTTLAVQLLLQLLASRQDGEPVPVLLSVAGWDVEAFPRLHDWLAMRLRQDYPALRATPLGDRAPAALAARGRLLPVLDGLDELPGRARAAVVTALNHSLGDDQLILTSRTGEFTDAVQQAGTVLTSAAVIEPQPLAPGVIADYLQNCLPSRPGPVWEHILTSLRTSDTSAAALTEVASTPLGLWLLRTVYIAPGADPAPLLEPSRFPTAATLRAHLFDRLIPTLITTRPPSNDPAEPFRPHQRHDPHQVIDWLGYLADHLSRIPANGGRTGTRDFVWWQLARHTLTRTARLTFALRVGLVVGLVVGLAWGLAWGRKHPVGGLVDGLVVGLVGVLVVGLVVGLRARSWALESPGFVDSHVAGRGPLLVRRVTRNMLVFGLLFGLMFVLVGALVVGLVSDLGVRILGVLTAYLAPGWVLVFGFLFGLVVGLMQWAETPTPAGRASTPMTNWRADRALNLTRTIVAGLVFGLVFGLAEGLGSGFTWGLGSGLAWGLAVGLAWALTVGLAVGLMVGGHHAWLAYLVATYHLDRDHRLPRRLMPFLNDAHRLGLLRAVGPIYQFRHAAFQDHLAEAYRRRGETVTEP